MSPTRSLAVAVAAAAIVVVAAVLVSFPREENSPTAAQKGNEGSITIITISGGSLLAGGTYTITPDPLGGSGAYSVQDGGEGDANPAAGMIEIRQVSAGNYTVAQSEAPPGYGQDRLSKIIEVKTDVGAATATFSNAEADAASPQPKSILYTAKFECGTISGSEGPLRPGHYDTDIGILNKQDFEVRLTWSAVLKDGKGTNAILKALEPQTTTGIVCKDIRKLVGGEKFAEGFIIITVPLDSGLQGALAGGSTVVVGRQSMDILDVQVFYTANALLELPHEVLVDKIVFAITGDPSGKVPADKIGKTLDVTVQSGYEISDPEDKVREALAEQYGLSGAEAGGLQIRVDSISVGAGTMIDDHALSLSRVPPQPAS